jgi:uncharacterized protein (DUF488 family)
MTKAVFTIGHSNHSMDRFLDLLRKYEISAIADVRSQPYSRFNPQFNREVLEKSLRSAGISYAFLGRELGARSEDKGCYVGGRVQYGLLAKTDLFRQGIERVMNGIEKHRIALLCAEKEPLKCHRTILVARQLAATGVEIQHILENGDLESHEAALSRLLKEDKLPESDLFLSREALIADAYSRREAEIAYREKVDSDAPQEKRLSR